jgi:hypothetical protein
VVKVSIKIYKQSGGGKMKKVLIVLAVFVFQGVAFSGEINVKAGVDPFRKMNSISSGKKEVGFSLGAEYLATINNFVKIGGGLEYVLPKTIKYGEYFESKLKKGVKEATKELAEKMPKKLAEEMAEKLAKTQKADVLPEPSYMPIYVSIKVIPIPTFFLKGNIGYSVYFDGIPKTALYPSKSEYTSGGLYYAVGVGHKFLLGLTLDVTYSHYGFGIHSGSENLRKGLSRIALNIGYSFKFL